ncbi:hypothetical protein Poli38472_006618 [Pythium oligandrum]|uniref:Crossover junction endonuclease MUS81-like HHH domain-containing protein n=1 Tax=Pythium oligandrum TaxID=41045 RepID=A0A8K1FFA8_PYTOL|nr:hypothetical protein Poli38472_006618 [Pythium oligandrum]|eukprot:TMW56608.1 hypothetical protein Poli38472_006618 [Pythium oligandrum]
MNLKQAQMVLSDFLMKCEEEGVELPLNAEDAVIGALKALQAETKHEMGRTQMEAAMAHMKTRYGLKSAPDDQSGDDEPKKPRSKKEPDLDEDADLTTRLNKKLAAKGTGSTISPKARRRPEGKKTKLQDNVRSKGAKRSENQPLVDQLVQLGEYEMHSGHTQRGIARMRAAMQVRDVDEVIKSGAQAKKLDRVGPSAAAKVDAILNAGLKGAMREYEPKAG